MAKTRQLFYVKENKEFTIEEFCLKYHIDKKNFARYNERTRRYEHELFYNGVSYVIYRLTPSLSLLRSQFKQLKEKNILNKKDVFNDVIGWWEGLVKKYPFHNDYITMRDEINNFYMKNKKFNFNKFIRILTEYQKITFCDTETMFKRFLKPNTEIEDIDEIKKWYKNNPDEKPFLWAWISLNKDDDNYVLLNYHDTAIYFDNISEKTLQYYHNLSFDGRYIAQMLIDELNYKIVNDKKGGKRTIYFFTDENKKIYAMKIVNKKNVTINIECSLLKLMSSVADLGKELGYPKLDLDYSTFRGKNYKPFTEKEIAYILADVTIVKRTMLNIEEKFRKRFKKEIEWKMTAGATSKNLLKNMFGKHLFDNLFENVLKPNEWKLLKDAYQGGYSNYNIKYVGKIINNVSSLDIKSCHPDKMQHYNMPFGKPIYGCRCDKDNYLNSSEHFKIYKVTINNTIKVKKDKESMIGIKDTFFISEDNFNNEVSSIDYLPFIKTGNVFYLSQYKLKLLLLNFDVKINDVYIEHLMCFKHSIIKELSDYITLWEGEKEQPNLKNENRCYYNWCKLNMNGIYGKWAEDIHLTVMKSSYFDKIVFETDKDKQKNIDDLKTLHYMPMAIAISDMARLMLFSMIETIGWDKWVNSDTDSCKFFNMSNKFFPENKPQYLNLINEKWESIYGKIFGKWDLEYTTKNFKCAGKKKYIYEVLDKNKNIVTKVVCAGANKAVKNMMNFNNFFVGFTSVEDVKTSKVMLNGIPVINNTSFKVKNVFKSKILILKSYKSFLNEEYYKEVLRIEKLVKQGLQKQEILVRREKEEYILAEQGEWS